MRDWRGQACYIRIGVQRLVFYVSLGFGLLLTLLSGLARLGQLYWVFDVLSHFHIQYTLGLLLCSTAAFFIRSKRPYLLLIPPLLLNGFLLMPFFIPVPTEAVAESAVPIKVVNFNVLAENPEHAAIAAYLRSEAADIVFLAELRPELLRTLQTSLADLYPYIYAEPSPGTYGLAFLSRQPFVMAETVALASRNRRVLSVSLDWHGQQLSLYGVHPLPPLMPRWARRRDEELQTVAELVAASPIPALVLGDFNASPWSYTMAAFRQVGLRHAARGHGIRPTWRYRSGIVAALTAAPIDHILLPLGWRSQRYSLGDTVGSDHSAVVALLEPVP